MNILNKCDTIKRQKKSVICYIKYPHFNFNTELCSSASHTWKPELNRKEKPNLEKFNWRWIFKIQCADENQKHI